MLNHLTIFNENSTLTLFSNMLIVGDDNNSHFFGDIKFFE